MEQQTNSKQTTPEDPTQNNVAIPPATNYVSATFLRLIEPITELYQKMIERGTSKPAEVQASFVENGYAIAIVALTAFLIEGACGRARYVKGDQDEISAIKTLKRLGDDDLAADVEEVFVIRDVVAHSHLWVAQVDWQRDDLIFVNGPTKLPAYGDAKFNSVVDTKSRTTRRLKLDVFPTKIRQQSAVIAMKQAVKVLRFLENIDRNIAYASIHHIRVGNNLILFFKWVDELTI